MNNDIEAPNASESTLLVAPDGNGASLSHSHGSADSNTLDTSVATESSIHDDNIKGELDRPWPATFDRGIQILAGPMLDASKIDFVSKSPSVRARYRKKNVSLVCSCYVLFAN